MFSFGKSLYEIKLMGLLQEKFFKTARRNKVLAQWAGGRLGYKDAAFSGYVRRKFLAYLLNPNDEKMVSSILNDFKRENIAMSEEVIKKKIQAIESRVKTKADLGNVD
ncbi:MAG: DUF1476 domain-containing protein [Holosporaceae bacterium]|jgi:hypothetical protein|nr:DUF1476 domain-containing protein [Holosporaceae bacterium]